MKRVVNGATNTSVPYIMYPGTRPYAIGVALQYIDHIFAINMCTRPTVYVSSEDTATDPIVDTDMSTSSSTVMLGSVLDALGLPAGIPDYPSGTSLAILAVQGTFASVSAFKVLMGCSHCKEY